MLSYNEVKAMYKAKNKIVIPKSFYDLLDKKIQENFDRKESKYILHYNHFNDIDLKEVTTYNSEQVEEFIRQISKEYGAHGWDVKIEHLFGTQYQCVTFLFKEAKPKPRSLQEQDL